MATVNAKGYSTTSSLRPAAKPQIEVNLTVNAKGYSTTSNLRPALAKGAIPEIESKLTEMFVEAVQEMFHTDYTTKQLQSMRAAKEPFTPTDLLEWETKLHSAVSQMAQDIAEESKDYHQIFNELSKKTAAELRAECKVHSVLYPGSKGAAASELAHTIWTKRNKKIALK